MTTTPPEQSPAHETAAAPRRSRAATLSLSLAIGALVAAAVLGGYFIIAGDQANIAGRAWLTLLLVGFFAGAVVLDAQVGDGPNRWYVPASTIVNVVLVAIGLLKLWNGWLQPADTADPVTWIVQGGRLLLIVILLRLVLFFTQLYGLRFVTRARSQIGRVMAVVTIALVWVAALVLVIPAAFPEHAWPDWWWRVAGAATLVAVVTTVIPLLIRAFEPKQPKPAAPAPQQYTAPQYAQQPYPPGYAPQAVPAPPVPPVAPAPPAAPSSPDGVVPPQ